MATSLYFFRSMSRPVNWYRNRDKACDEHVSMWARNVYFGLSFHVRSVGFFCRGSLRLSKYLRSAKNAFEIDIFGVFIDTNLTPPKKYSEAKLFLANDVISIDHVLAGVQSHVSRLGVLFRVWPSLRVWCALLSKPGLCVLVYFICSRTRLPRLWDVNRGSSCIWLDLLI